MTDRIDKVLQRMPAKERTKILEIIEEVKAGDLSLLDIKKLRERDDVYRVRKGKFRIIYRTKNGVIQVITLERRSDTTYKNI